MAPDYAHAGSVTELLAIVESAGSAEDKAEAARISSEYTNALHDPSPSTTFLGELRRRMVALVSS